MCKITVRNKYFFNHHINNLDLFKQFDISELPEREKWETSMFYSEFMKLDEHSPTTYLNFLELSAGYTPKNVEEYLQIFSPMYSSRYTL